jgi:hypothetical protein
MQLLTDMGLPTGFRPGDDPMEWHELASPQFPMIIKRPQFCVDLKEWIAGGLVVQHAIVPIRDLTQAADSRRRRAVKGGGPNANGGLVWTTNPAEQERALADKFYNLMLTLAQNDIPVLLLDFDLVNSPELLFAALEPVFFPAFPSFVEASFKCAYSRASARREG